MIVVTAGNKYLDIDAYASCIAYTKLLNSMGVQAIFATSAQPNVSVASNVRDYDKMMVVNYESNLNDEFVVLDVSNPEFIDKIVNLENIVEVIDHHTGFEDFWAKKGCKSQIEFIGSVATMIFEKIIEEDKAEILDASLCKLLTAAILDNTLNLKSSITTKRDLQAYEMLKVLGQIEPNFDEKYFRSCQTEVNKDVVLAVKRDIKNEYVADILPTVFGQITVYDKEPIFEESQKLSDMFETFNKSWLLNVICIKDGKSYIFSTDAQAQQNLQKLFKSKFSNDVLVLENFMLRKQIMKQARTYAELNENKQKNN